MIRKYSRILIIVVLAFAAAIYFLFFKGQNGNPGGEGLSRFKVETIRVENGWGYLIRQDTVPVIEQKVIPGLPGTNGFATEQQAAKTGGLVKEKLDRGIFPPTVSIHELDSLGIKY
ncbi:DUF4907 domain-containing protein [Dyadobacter sp. CY261]|uniref:DUF4907 domain-containing protein n=1 Tax=Dyadobacter sp. CY261 TaxID=2907203 RepID=UPI001F3BFC4E|nr:DUF4907 domain-containing protein [Dyadobacter sp. CY261]MCF0075155.1 DUF4907 domain-containing protein [Dyadobacter sp. CY261]